jgi:tetratricopeptide (TPR) repeat protein
MINPLNWLKYQYHNYQAQRSVSKHNYQDAWQRADLALRFYPQGLYALQSRAYANFQQGKLDEALVDLSQAMAIKKSGYLFGLQIYIYQQKKDYQHVVEICNEALLLEPYNDWFWFYRGQAYERLNNLREAAASYRNAANYNPDTRYYLELAKTQADLDLWDDALKTWEEAIKKSGHLPSIYNERGHARLNRKEKEQAEADFLKAIELAKRERDLQQELTANHYLGWLYMAQFKNYDKALECYNFVLELKPKDRQAHLNRALVYIRQRNYDAALEDTDIALAQKSSRTALNYKGFILAQKEDFEQALSYFEQGIIADPEDSLPYSNIACIYLRQNKLQEALENAEKGYALKTNIPSAAGYLAVVHFELGNVEKAAELWNEVLKIDSNYASTEWIRTDGGWSEWMISRVEPMITYLNSTETHQLAASD